MADAVKEFFGFRGGLSETPRSRPTFYALIMLALIGGLLMSILNIDPIQALVVTAIINGIVAFGLGRPFLVIIVALLWIGLGARSLQHLPVDAYPDLSPPMVEIDTQLP